MQRESRQHKHPLGPASLSRPWEWTGPSVSRRCVRRVKNRLYLSVLLRAFQDVAFLHVTKHHGLSLYRIYRLALGAQTTRSRTPGFSYLRLRAANLKEVAVQSKHAAVIPRRAPFSCLPVCVTVEVFNCRTTPDGAAAEPGTTTHCISRSSRSQLSDTATTRRQHSSVV